jgi:fluoride ion exporter CrcB/FEX
MYSHTTTTSSAQDASSRNDPVRDTTPDEWTEHFEQLTTQFHDKIARPSRDAAHRFFYPKPRGSTTDDNDDDDDPAPRPECAQPTHQTSSRRRRRHSPRTSRPNRTLPTEQAQDDDRAFVHHFWTTYDDIIILSLFTQLGICFRLASASWFAYFDDVFFADSALFVVLPLNCLSCFIMGALGSGERLMEILATRCSAPPVAVESRRRGAAWSGDPKDKDDDDDDDDSGNSSHHSSIQGDGLYKNNDEKEEDNNNDDDDTNNNNNFDDSIPPMNHPGRRHWTTRVRRRRPQQQERFHHWEPPLPFHDELRHVQLFPVRKQDVDVMEHYFQQGYKRRRTTNNNNNAALAQDDDDDESYETKHVVLNANTKEFYYSKEHGRRQQQPHNSIKAMDADQKHGHLVFDLELHEEEDGQKSIPSRAVRRTKSAPDDIAAAVAPSRRPAPLEHVAGSLSPSSLDHRPDATVASSDVEHGSNSSPHPSLSSTDDFISTTNNVVTDHVTEHWSRLRRANIADGWDAGTTTEDMSDDLMLGLRDGFCGALSSFSSWVSAMVQLIRHGNVGRAAVGLMLGLQLPIIAYRFGQHVAVYVFVWRCRFESKRDERRGYGIRVAMNEDTEREAALDAAEEEENGGGSKPGGFGRKPEGEIPSVRAILTAVFVMAIATQVTMLSFFADPEHHQIALSLLFSPLGVFARWRLSKYNSWRPTFPLGTFTANILACALAGSLGSLLAGNPGDRERIVLVSIVAGFGGTMSSLATFVVEVLAGIDPILFRFDGMIYAVLSIFWAMVICFLLSASADWADTTSK